ncbi:hypothetical protein SLE2022_067910 [Rubroshorea leprosula]
MDSRINFGEEFAIPEDKELQFMGSLVPITPEKNIPRRSGQIPAPDVHHGSQLTGADWPELAEFPKGYFQDLLNCNGVLPNFNPIGTEGQTGGHYASSSNVVERNRMINNIAGSYTHTLYNMGGGRNSNPLTNVAATRNAAAFASATRNAMADGPLTPNLHSQADNWRLSNTGNLALGNQNHSGSNNMVRHDQTHDTSFHLLRNNNSFHQMHMDGFPLPSKPIYNINSPVRAEADAISGLTTSFPFTPDLPQKLENNLLSALLTSTNESSSHEKERQKDLMTSTVNEVTCDELLQNIVDSSAVISTPTKEKKDSDGGSDQGIDLNKTPQQKPSKRRKYRPKAVVEGKHKRTPKTATPTNTSSKENPSGKRKYVRKKGLKESAIEQDTIRESDPCAGGAGKRKYVRRKGLTESPTGKEDSAKQSNPGAGGARKRNYMHKNGLKDSVTEEESIKETCAGAGAATKSCRRVLDFETEKMGNGRQGQLGKHQEMQEGHNISNCQNTGFWDAVLSGSGTKSTAQIYQQNGLAADNEQPRTINNHTTSLNKLNPANHIMMLGTFRATASEDPQMGNLNPIARNVNMGFVDSCQESSRSVNSSIEQNIHLKRIGQVETIDRARELMCQHTPQPVPNNLFYSDEGRSKKEYCHAMEQRKSSTLGPMTTLLCQEIFQTDGCFRNGSILEADCLEAHKRKKTEYGSHMHIHTRPSCSTPVNDGSRQAETRITYNVNAENFSLLRNCGTFDPHLESKDMARRKFGEASQLTGDRHVYSSAPRHTSLRQHIPSELHSGIERMAETNQLIQVHNLAAAENHNHLPPPNPAENPAPQRWVVLDANNAFPIRHGNIFQKQNTEPSLFYRASSATGRLLHEKEGMHDYLLSSAKAKGNDARLYSRQVILIDEMINKIKDLSLNERNNDKEQNALVPYKGDGNIVPYKAFDFTKKRKSRPKVDLDPETNKVWKLLMGKEGNDVEGTDKEKEKWWEEERRVFRGRADSFIARMHLIQGDRRFSKWKGSVVDSVIGVYLTQNVSDHLSSSAFMSLAARFPRKSKCMRTGDGNEAIAMVTECQVCEPNLNTSSTIKWRENPSIHSFNSQISEVTSQSADYRKDSENSGIERASLTDTHSQNLDEEVLSSQGSYDSSVIQLTGGIRSYSGSNSEGEDPTTGCNLKNNNVSTLHQMGNTTLFEEFYNSVNKTTLFHEGLKHGQKQLENGQLNSRLDKMDNLKGFSIFNQADHFKNQQRQVPDVPLNNYQPHMTSESEVVDLEGFGLYDEECMSSWVSPASRFSKPKQPVENDGKPMVQQDGLPRCQETGSISRLLCEHAMYQQEISQPASHTKSSQPCNNIRGIGNKSFQIESASVRGPLNLNALANSQNSTVSYTAHAQLTERTSNIVHNMPAMSEQKETENKLTDSNSGKLTNSTFMRYDKTKSNISKVKRRKTEDKKDNAIDWDSLRRQVQANGSRKERTEDTMDSLDYEAMRQADVNEISRAIKERGMNNMLAERIKEFLNRMVREHGSIDLEWLRDVPPDKAKDYLLSIRGLGLKSVECIRLLTLHHVAFPVDTNVGRIAVRLGWVPLQPLPESLQLHLLELYPVLESIQKYLWPRLCKLDQRTLYELHYQMITFGKVFCTKSKPNCNACPLRGECRHFASAFASARLALPGPEEKSITSSGVPIMAERNPPEVFNPMLPAPAENNTLGARSSHGNCEPIIEEPATPEPVQTEVSLSDIEDAFYEDPDEIPTIRLNVEEFAANLQHYMEENMELQEGDMSKALVALNTEAASIPMPKLKNVSRLRTEHHVYELPDNHPLLQGMDKREPDDPSPYLLAIWTPGETANSTEPPEEKCGSQEPGKLCSEKTCFSCNSIREANAQMVRGTLLIPCRTAMRGSFPLNGTYFQVNEVFADHESSLNPIDVPREWIWNLPRRIVYFGTSVSTIFKGLSTEGIQYCFWKGFVCVRGFDQKTRAPRPLIARLHFPASKQAKTRNENKR